MADPASLPGYRELPVRTGLPPGSAWGVFGEADEVGTVNLLTPERVAEAAGLVRTGRVFPLSWGLDKPNPPGRPAFKHVIEFDKMGADDYYDSFYTQISSSLDSLSRIRHPVHGYYNGRHDEDVTGREGSRNGIDNWARRGVVGRFVLADLGRARARQGRPFDMKSSEPVEVEELEAVLEDQGVELRPADILLLRFGWIGWYESAGADDRAWVAGGHGPIRNPGLSHDEAMAAWLWDRHVAFVGADNPTLEVWPPELTEDGFLHFRLIPLLGIGIGELFDLGALAMECDVSGIYEGMFAAAPMNKLGGVGSPANALAIT